MLGSIWLCNWLKQWPHSLCYGIITYAPRCSQGVWESLWFSNVFPISTGLGNDTMQTPLGIRTNPACPHWSPSCQLSSLMSKKPCVGKSCHFHHMLWLTEGHIHWMISNLSFLFTLSTLCTNVSVFPTILLLPIASLPPKTIRSIIQKKTLWI